MKAIQELKAEHHGIQVMLKILQSISKAIDTHQSVDSEHLKSIHEFLAVFADKCHHGKEEDILFPALQAKGNITMLKMLPILLQEHATGRGYIRALGKKVQEYSAGNRESLKEIGILFRQYSTLLQEHIKSEDETVFPALEHDLDDSLDAELFERFEQLETDVIGLGRHEQFHAMLENYSDIYK